MNDGEGAEQPRQKRRPVAEADGDHVGREPELGVEYGLKHVHRVARVEPVRDHECQAASDRRHEIADPQPMEPLEHKPGKHTRPADEHSRRVEIYNRRPAGEPDSHAQGERVEYERAGEKPPGERADLLPAHEEARKAGDDRRHVEPLG